MLRVVGAGVGRTGTSSLQVALERLLGGRCYHMFEVFGHAEEHVPAWRAAYAGEPVDWDRLFDGYVAAVDWPAAGCWETLAARYPDALVLLSTRDPADWWASASRTIFRVMDEEPPEPMHAWWEMTQAMMAAFDPDWRDEAAATAAFVRHNDAVRAAVPASRLVEWHPGDGWQPLCSALGVPVPDEPFPHRNSTDEFRTLMGWD